MKEDLLTRGSRGFSLPSAPGFYFRPSVAIDGREVVLRAWRSAGRAATFLASSPVGEWRLTARKTALGVEIVLAGRLIRAARHVVLRPLGIRSWKADHLAVQGRKLGGCRLVVLQGGERGEEEFVSHFFVAVTRRGVTTLLSHPFEQGDLSRFAGCHVSGGLRRFAAETSLTGTRRGAVRSAPVTVSASSDGHALLHRWADTRLRVTEPIAAPQTSGWNSWDYYRWTVTEEDVLKNAEFIAADPVLSRHVTRIVVDDGWQYCYGEWEPNPLFPSGMADLARRLRRLGFEAGLWFAPTIVEPHARWAQCEPETLAAGASGFPCLAFSCMERKGFLLDPTHPKVRAWWDAVFRKYAGFGYRFYKLDFLSWTVPWRRFHDPRCRPGHLMRRILEPIRSAVGPDARILGCNLNFEDVRGLADEVRISADIHARWVSVKENAAAIALRSWTHRRFWVNDPDFAVCRGAETSDDPDLHRLKPILPFVRPDDPNPARKNYLDSLVDLSAAEAEVLLSLVIVSGGVLNLSDNLPRLNGRGIALLRRAVQARKGNAAVALDLFTAELPARWIQKLEGGLHRVLLVNWTDHSAVLTLDLAAWNVPRGRVTDFWHDGDVALRGGRVERALSPHSCLLLETTP